MATGDNVTLVCGTDQLDSGLKGGIEGPLTELNVEEGWGFLLVDARNAFSIVNWTPALWNDHVLWPRCCYLRFNTYRATLPSRIVTAFLAIRRG